ncbi:MAG: TIGR00288 family NYN domain-containing protein [Candidatus Micrarchaeota archaeon]
MSVLGRLKKEKKSKKRMAFFVDGPNMLRREFDIDLAVVKKQLEQFGNLSIAKIFLNQFAPDKLIEAVINQGFQPVMVTSDDVDAPMAAEAMEAVFNNNIDIIALMTRDSDFQTVLTKAKKYGKETIVVGSEPFAVALKNTADHVIIIKTKRSSKEKGFTAPAV